MGSSSITFAKVLFILLGCLMLWTLVDTIRTDGLPFRKEILTPWMTATLVDFYINVAAIAVWIAYKELSWISAIFWIILLVCFGSITTCTYIVMQLFKLSSSQAIEDPFYNILLRSPSRISIERKKFSSVVALRILFGVLGCLMLGTLIYTLLTDGSPFREELLTPWMVETLVDFYVNVVAISAWVVYKEPTGIGALFWIVLLICFGSITTCSYIVMQLFHLSSQDPYCLVLLNTRDRKPKS
ncbi:uncharacterized protein LOC143892418 isoform X2 [Tasmannia lanceolata]|uniref:uncharacterized protein LOC143892418 isoform X2 n=1 Tax=Tasmannia lanceolata TaxID=3420 RepID=UPI0040635378